MCAPIAGIAALAAGVLGSVVQFSAAEAQADAQDHAWKQNYVNSLAAGREEYTALQARELQEQDALAQKLHLSELEEAKALGTATAVAADSNVAGLSVDALLRDISASASFNREAERTNYEWTATQLQSEKRGSQLRVKDRINAVPAGNHPSPLGLVAGIAGTGFQHFAQM